MEREKLITEMFEKGILLNREIFDENIQDTFLQKIESEPDLLVLNADYAEVINHQSHLVDWYEIDRYRVDAEKDRDNDLYQQQLQHFKSSHVLLQAPHFSQEQQLSSLEAELQTTETTFSSAAESQLDYAPLLLQQALPGLVDKTVTIIISYENKARKYTIKDFTTFFASRYRFLEGILRHRQELQNNVAIGRLAGKKEEQSLSVIGLVDDIHETQNHNLIITLEDLTGKIKVLFSKNKKEIYALAKDLVFDEVVGISGVFKENIIFAENIVWPDIPLDHELKKGPTEEYAIFLSDIHVGSALFLQTEFDRFLRWINGRTGNEAQRQMAQQVKYIFIIGDLVDGVGVYPSQEDELKIKDIIQQYAEFCRLISQIPSDKRIIICPGNHDVVHLAEPQSVFYKEYIAGLDKIPHVSLVTNPALINIGKTDMFSGFDVLMYHGYSFDYYVANVESIRLGGGYHRADLIMKFLLKRRHLAPSFRSTPYFPAHREDPLLITKIPDFLATGHIHYSNVANYKGITMISGSCWQGITSFQEKLGHQPEPARVPVVNLRTREIKVLKFI